MLKICISELKGLELFVFRKKRTCAMRFLESNGLELYIFLIMKSNIFFLYEI